MEEEVRIVVNQLRERLDKHNGNRISVQDMLDPVQSYVSRSL